MKKRSQFFMLTASLLLLTVFFMPLWQIRLDAPQYPNGLNLFISVNKIEGEEFSLKNINIMNHYVGMKEIDPKAIPELTYFPYIVIGLSLLGILFAFSGKKSLYFTFCAIMVIVGILGMYDFYLWEYDYGHDLNENAAIKIPGMAYQPPLIGSKQILNFVATSLPREGAYMLALSVLVAGLAWLMEGKNKIATLLNPKR